MDIMPSLTYELRPCEDIKPRRIEDYLEEFKNASEPCNVLWQLEHVTVDEWLEGIKQNRSTMFFAFYVDDCLVGICRITPKPNHEANGMVGFAIRPTWRGSGYAATFLRMIDDISTKVGLDELTACVDAENIRSIRSFERAGWARTGRWFAWTPNPRERQAIEFTNNKKDA